MYTNCTLEALHIYSTNEKLNKKKNIEMNWILSLLMQTGKSCIFINEFLLNEFFIYIIILCKSKNFIYLLMNT